MNRKMTFTYKDKATDYKINRKQLWILPAFSITVDASQGRTTKKAIVHLDGLYQSACKPYVMQSRVTNGDDFHVIGSWKDNLFSLKPDKHMVQYLETHLKPKEITTLLELQTIKTTISTLEDNFHTLKSNNPRSSTTVDVDETVVDIPEDVDIVPGPTKRRKTKR